MFTPTQTSNEEKRRYTRVPVELDVNLLLIEDGVPRSVDVTVRDLSVTGMGFLPCNLNLQPNQPVEVSANGCAGVEARVQWVSSRGFGLHLTQKPKRVVRTWVGHVLELKGFDLDSISLN